MNTKQGPRIFAYTTGVLMLSTLYYVATYNYYEELENLRWQGTVAWLFFLITSGNVSYFLAKRFLRGIHFGSTFRTSNFWSTHCSTRSRIRNYEAYFFCRYDCFRINWCMVWSEKRQKKKVGTTSKSKSLKKIFC